jgi:hypothetical protein
MSAQYRCQHNTIVESTLESAFVPVLLSPRRLSMSTNASVQKGPSNGVTARQANSPLYSDWARQATEPATVEIKWNG